MTSLGDRKWILSIICFLLKEVYFCLVDITTLKPEKMKKIVLLVAFAAFLSACSQYTCPTYSKKEAPKKADSERRI